jgi:hypothetical protein
MIDRECGLLEADLLEDHIVLCECACLVCEEVLYAPQVFGNVGISRDRALDPGIDVDLVGVLEFGEF